MKISFNCPNCKFTYKSDESNIGRKAKCISCGESFIVDGESDQVDKYSTTKISSLYNDNSKKFYANILKWIGYIFGGIGQIIFGIIGFIIHIYTFFLAYNSFGFLGGLITLAFPVLSEIFWFIKIWRDLGSLDNLYCQLIIWYVSAPIIFIIGLSIISFFIYILKGKNDDY